MERTKKKKGEKKSIQTIRRHDIFVVYNSNTRNRSMSFWFLFHHRTIVIAIERKIFPEKKNDRFNIRIKIRSSTRLKDFLLFGFLCPTDTTTIMFYFLTNIHIYIYIIHAFFFHLCDFRFETRNNL